MAKQSTEAPKYRMSVSASRENPDALAFRFVSGEGDTEYVVVVDPNEKDPTISWHGRTVDVSSPIQEDLEAQVRKWVEKRRKWIGLVGDLVDSLEKWAKDLQWATRRIEKRLNDSQIGPHIVPALLLQQDLVRVIVEPVSRVTPGGEGLVDLYLMPSYADIASLYYRDGIWQVHYIFPHTGVVSIVEEAEAKPLSMQVLREVLDEMKKNVD